MKRHWLATTLWALLGTVAAVVFAWLVLFKLLSKLLAGRGAPCPASLGWLVDNPIRRRYMRPVLDRVGIRPGETVLEVGPGPGLFTLDAARQAGLGGRVIAVDIQPQMIARLDAKVRAAGLQNVETHVASAYELPLPDASVDRAFLVTVLPEIPDPVRALREIRRVLKPAGLLSLTEEFYDPDYPRRATTIAWARKAGFALRERLGNFWVYTLNFAPLAGEEAPLEPPPQAASDPGSVGALGAISDTMLITLGCRAIETRQPAALLRDPRAAEIVERLGYDLTALEKSPFHRLNPVLRAREFDRAVRAFLAQHPDGVVVDIGCGLDTRFERVDNGRVRWYNLDLPAAMALREQLFPPLPRCRNLPYSALDPAWMDIVAAEAGPYLFLAEGVLAYLEEEQVRGLVLALGQRFPGSEFVFDALPRLLPRVSGLHPLLRRSQARVRWGLGDSRAIEGWGEGLRLLTDWRYYEQGEPRLGPYNLLRWMPVVRDFRVLRYRLGGAAAEQSPYASQQLRLLRDFDQAVRRVRGLLVARLGEGAVAAIVEESRAEYTSLIPQMPYLGGKQPFTEFVVFTAWFLAMYRVLKRRGYSLEDVGRLIHEMGRAFIAAYPAYLLRVVGRRYFSPRHLAEVRRRAAASPRSPYPDDYLYDFIAGDGTTFDWGVDYRRCAGVEFLKQQGAAELGPYLCAADVLYSDAFGWGLSRTTTLAEGYDRCDFRFKKGAPTRVAVVPALRK